MTTANTLFRKATRQAVKASIMIEGLPGLGKSGLALAISNALASSQDKIFAIDTENQSLDLYDKFKLHTGTVVDGFIKADISVEEGYKPSNYEALRQSAIDAGGEVLIIDSFSHMWNRKGGLLDLVSQTQQAGGTGINQYTAWGTEQNRKEKELIYDLLRSNKLHTIVTVRNKEKFSLEFNEAKGKNEVKSLGEQQIQQEGLKYEPDLVIRMVSPGTQDGKAPVGYIVKSRYAIFTPEEEYEFTDAILQQFKAYLQEGVDPEELLETQKQGYIQAIKNFCNTTVRKSIWKQLKDDAGFSTTPIEEMPTRVLKILYGKLTED